MKKLAFTLQVFGLLAMLPIVVILEINHVTGSVQRTNTSPDRINKTENAMMGLPAKATAKLSDEVPGLTLETIMLKTAY